MTSNELIERTKQLITIPSTADNLVALKQAVDFVHGIVAAHPDITIERFESNGKHSFLAYRGNTRPEKFDILLNGHLDVVPGNPELFKPHEQNGRLYGRGALDMKGTALVLTDVFCELVNKVPYNLGLQIVSDEEIGGYNGVKVHIGNGVRANFIIMGEYANDQGVIYNAARGLCWAEIAFNGKSAHGGHLWHGTNAVVKAGDFASAVLKRYPTPDKETWTTTASIANLSTPNDTFNKVPDQAILKIDFRFTQEDPVFRDRDSVEAFVHSIDPDATVINLATFEPAVHVEESNPYVQGMNAAMKEVTGTEARFLGRPAASDGRHYALVQSDIVEFGLYGKGSHSNEEYVELQSFAEYQAILRAFLRQPIPQKLKKSTAQPLHEKLLGQLVEMRTTTGDLSTINNALRFIENFLRSRGMHVERYERNGVASVLASTKPGGNKKPTVLLNAHIDAVPASDDLYKLTLKKDRFIGRGVMDMKHAVAAYLTLVDNLQGELDAYDFGIMITSDEEVGSGNGAKPLVHEEGYRPRVVIVPDGGNNWKLERFAKGVYWIELSAAGKRAHASRPWEGDSAIHRLLGALKEVEQLVPAQPHPEDTLLSVGTIKGGTTANQIPAEATAMLDIRTGSVADHQALPGKIEDICKRHGVTMTIVANEGPSVTDPQNPYVKHMVDIVEELTGETHETSFDYAVTDGRFFTAVGVPTVVINPECGDIHGDNEWLSRSGFTTFCQAIERYIRRVAAIHPQSAPSTQEISQLAERLNSENSPAYNAETTKKYVEASSNN